MPTDIELAQAAIMQPIANIADKLGLTADSIENFGKFKAKINLNLNPHLPQKPSGKLVLVTAISPTPPGEGKTTTTVGLADALQHIGKKSIICLREPSMGPVFGKKGGAAGGGRAQVVPMEDINLHFTGDFAAIQTAHNLLAAMIDNHIFQGNSLQIDPKSITWRRVLDMNDRALRQITVGLGAINGHARDDGFDIVVASEVMAILCLCENLQDLKARLGSIVIGENFAGEPVTASQLQAQGAMTVILKDAIKPNLVQSIENTPALIHGGPFANIAHGCNSIIATKTALKLADYVVTEAGFGADLGAEKFINIKCRKAGLAPDVCVIVATVRALKYHGGANLSALTIENLHALNHGMANLEKHVFNITQIYKLPCVVSINQFDSDTAAELAMIKAAMQAMQVHIVTAQHWAKGGAGAIDLANIVVKMCELNQLANEQNVMQPSAIKHVEIKPDRTQALAIKNAKKTTSPMQFVYADTDTLWQKCEKVATKIYGASHVTANESATNKLTKLQEKYGHYPICFAKTQSSFSTDKTKLGAPEGHVVNIVEVRLNAGAEFIVLVCDDILTMPGLPKEPCATRIDIDAFGQVTGLY